MVRGIVIIHNKKTGKMKDTIKDVIKALVFGAVIIAGLVYAGRSDYRDAVVTEMKNNGTYYSMQHEHPDWTEGQMVEAYVDKE